MIHEIVYAKDSDAPGARMWRFECDDCDHVTTWIREDIAKRIRDQHSTRCRGVDFDSDVKMSKKAKKKTRSKRGKA
jgi:hypothetical protein